MVQRLKHLIGPGPFAMLLAGLFFACMAVMVKKVSGSIPVFEITFFRAAVSALIIGIGIFKKGISLKGSNQKILMVRALSGFTAMCLNFYAIGMIKLGDAALLHQTTPVFVMILSWIFLSEKFYPSLLSLIFITFMGVALVLRPSGEVFNLGGGAALLSAVFASGAYVAIRHLHQTESHWTMAFYFMFAAAVLSLVPMLLTWKTPTLSEAAMLVMSGIFGTLGQLFMTYAYKHEEASWVAPFSYAGVLFAIVFGIVFFEEVPDGWTLFGAMLIVLGGVFLVRLKNSVRLPIPETNPAPSSE